MRDGLQSLSKVYSLEQKKKFMQLLNSYGPHCIEFGSTTSEKLLPQMAKSFDLYKQIDKNSNTKYTMLVTSFDHTQRVLDSGIYSFGLVCSASEIFAHKNLKKTSEQSVNTVIEQINLITEYENLKKNTFTPHIRVYLSCSFGSPWEKFNSEYLNNMGNFITKFLECAKEKKLSAENFDIVISDTVGLNSVTRISNIVYMIGHYVGKKQMDYFALHAHCKPDNFYNVVDQSIKSGIIKIDSSMLGIGGCPFAEDETYGNVNTSKLVEWLSKNYNYCSKEQVDKIVEVENELKKILTEN
jgi:hydroxymethylglutaryl-CoA lyase